MKKAILAIVMAVSLIFTCTSAFAQNPAKDKYTDISGHWANEAINKVADESIFKGNDGKFLPSKPITRSEFVILLHKALGIQISYFKATDIAEYYSDVKNDDPIASPLYDLVTANIIDYKGQFKPKAALSREDMVHFIINSLEYMTGGNYAMIDIYPMPFSDDAKINPSYKEDFLKAQVLKLVNGNRNGRFLPEKSATRAEAATIVLRLQNLLKSLKVEEEVKLIPSVTMGQDSIDFDLIIANNTKEKVTINHTSGQKYDFQLLGKDKNILYTWSADKMFYMIVGTTVIEPGESVEFKDTVQKEAYMDNAKYMKAYIVGSSDDFTINPDGYEIPINNN